MASNERRYRPGNYTPIVSRAASTVNTMTSSLTSCPPPPDPKNPYYRRQAGDAFPQPGLEHIVPTVAISSLAASTTTSDLSIPTPMQIRPQFPLMKRFTPTRIPSPVWDKLPTGRHVSTPVLPGQKTNKENVQHRTHQGSISSSDKPPSLLPKSRTMGMLSNFTTPFSRSNLSLNESRQASITSTHPADVTACDLHYTTLPLFTPNTHQIHASKINSYWCGRFQALCDRFQDEQIETILTYDVTYIPSPPSTPTPTRISKESDEYESKTPEEVEGHNLSRTASVPVNIFIDPDKISSRAFLHLQSLCTTNEARRSLWEFQLHFARTQRKAHLLPRGGKMVDDRVNWFGRVGRAMVGGNNTSLGPRTSMGRRKSSMVSFLNP